MENGDKAKTTLAENALLNPLLTGKSAKQIEGIYRKAYGASTRSTKLPPHG